MKKIITLLFIGLFISVNAQITFTENDGPKVGLKIYTRSLDHSLFDLNHLMETGGNKNWDIIGTFEANDTTEFIAVDNLLFKDKFPGCNMALVKVPNVDNSYVMIEKNANGLYWLGSHDDISEIVYTPKYKFVSFPLNFGANFQNFVSSDYKVDTFDIQLDIQSNSTVDAWGTISTNDGTYPVIKLKVFQIHDITYEGLPLGATIFSYHWLASGFGSPLATLEITEFEDFVGNIYQDTTLTYIYKQEVVVSNKDLTNPKAKLSISPNPVSDLVTIECQNVNFNAATYAIINAEGKTVMEGNLHANEILNLNMNQLTGGNYLVQLILDKKTMLFDILSKK